MMNSNFITFITPTIGRHSISQTIQSLRKLKKTNWESIIVFDGVPNIYLKQLSSPTFRIFEIPKTGGSSKQNHAGKVRNYAFPYVRTPWIGFIDDDDTLSPYYIDYVEKELEINEDIEVIIFRMVYKDMRYLPSEHQNYIQKMQVGISFCFRTSLLEKFPQLKFQNDSFEDFLFLQQCKDLECKMVISPFVAYYVKSNYFPFQKELPRHIISSYSYSFVKHMESHFDDIHNQSQDIVYIECKGGLGNLCYQISLGEWIRHQFDKKVYYIFDEKESHSRKWIYQYSLFQNLPILPLSSCSSYSMIEEEYFHENILMEQKNPFYIKGYFQNIRRYQHCFEKIKGNWNFSNYDKIKKQFEEWKQKKKSKKIIGIHVRGKDYLSLSHFYKIIPNSYYDVCFEKLGYEYHKTNYECILFTDDKQYVKSNMSFFRKYHISFTDEVFPSLLSIPDEEKELYLFSLCDILILSNSTFSLWSNYLGTSSMEKVFIPSCWYQHYSVFQPLPNLLKNDIQYECISWDEESLFS